MLISELFTPAWFGGAFYEQPMHCFFHTVAVMVKKEDVKGIRPA
ncbi:hypothetical protein [Aeromonas diversa]|nr:hypothetical protein [Aeromonas diversa]